MGKIEGKPLRATLHCRHYDYVVGEGPRCAKGVDLSGSGASAMCMPGGSLQRGTCALREEYTATERDAWKEWSYGSINRMFAVMELVPSAIGGEDRKHWGTSGEFACPNCEVGKVRWARSRSNGHIWAVCSTSQCTQFMQ